MMARTFSYPTVDELISTIGHSQLPTLFTEGRDDFELFRRLEEKCASIGLSVLAVGGKPCLMELFARRDEIRGGPQIAFFADKDLWVFTGVPEEYNNEIFLLTDGYSIENDLYVDGELEDLLLASERVEFANELNHVIKWYSCAIEKRLRGIIEKIDYHPNHLLGSIGNKAMLPDVIDLDDQQQSMFDMIVDSYHSLLRGKTLVAILLRFLSQSKRYARFSRTALLDIGMSRGGNLMKKTYGRLDAIFKQA